MDYNFKIDTKLLCIVLYIYIYILILVNKKITQY